MDASDTGVSRAGLVSLTIPAFRLALAAMLIQHIGVWMRVVALGWLVVERTGSSMTLGLTYFWTYLPFILVSPPAGALGDRIDRKRLLVIAAGFLATNATVMAIVVHLTRTGMWPIYLLTFAIGCSIAIIVPTMQVLAPALVPRDMLPSAIAVNSIFFNVTRVIGPALAGVTVARLGVSACFYLYALTSLVFLGMWQAIDVPHQPPATPQPILATLRHGLAYVSRQPTMALLVLTATAVSLGSQQLQMLLPAVAKQVLGLDANGLGVLGAAIGIGGIGGTVGVSVLVTQRARAWALVGSLALLGLSMIAIASAGSLRVAALAAAAFGSAVFGGYALTNTLVQLAVPESMRGRVMAIYTVGAIGVYPLAALLSGFISSRVGVPWAIGGAGLVMVGYGAWLGSCTRALAADHLPEP